MFAVTDIWYLRRLLSHNILYFCGKGAIIDCISYGYDKDENEELVINWEQAQVVRKIFQLYLEGNSIVGIIRDLESRQICSPSGKEKWSKKSIENILCNEKYTGTVRLLDSVSGACEYLAKDNHPPIITEDVFQRVQEMRADRSNVIKDENGTHRKHSKYSSKSKK